MNWHLDLHTLRYALPDRSELQVALVSHIPADILDPEVILVGHFLALLPKLGGSQAVVEVKLAGLLLLPERLHFESHFLPVKQT